jgi:hypothetical protein
MSIELTDEERQALKNVRECDGYEVHVDDWPFFEKLAAKGLIILGGARGPGKYWRRATPVYIR